jgi:hypothetical protein
MEHARDDIRTHLQTEARAFENEAAAIRRQVIRIESTTWPEPLSTRSSGGFWPQELNAIDTELNYLERSWSQNPSAAYRSLPVEGDQ